MINLLRGEFYKLIHNKCFYICCMVVLIGAFSMYGMFSLADAVQNGEMQSENLVVTTEGATVWDEMDVFSIAKSLFASVGEIIVAIYIAITLFGDYANGAIKNVVGKGYERTGVFLSKFLMGAFGAVVIEIVLALGVLLCELVVLKGERLSGAVLADYCGFVGMQLLFVVALAGIMFFINQLCRNLGLGIAISVCLIMFSSLITMGINTILQYFHCDVNVCEYWILDLISECTAQGMKSEFLVRALLSCLAWTVVSFAVGVIHFRKADVK